MFRLLLHRKIYNIENLIIFQSSLKKNYYSVTTKLKEELYDNTLLRSIHCKNLKYSKLQANDPKKYTLPWASGARRTPAAA